MCRYSYCADYHRNCDSLMEELKSIVEGIHGSRLALGSKFVSPAFAFSISAFVNSVSTVSIL